MQDSIGHRQQLLVQCVERMSDDDANEFVHDVVNTHIANAHIEQCVFEINELYGNTKGEDAKVRTTKSIQRFFQRHFLKLAPFVECQWGSRSVVFLVGQVKPHVVKLLVEECTVHGNRTLLPSKASAVEYEEKVLRYVSDKLGESIFFPRYYKHEEFIVDDARVHLLHMTCHGPLNLLQWRAALEAAPHRRLEKIRHVLACLALGLSDLHNVGVAHRDLKLENVVVGNEPEVPVIVDYGNAVLDAAPIFTKEDVRAYCGLVGALLTYPAAARLEDDAMGLPYRLGNVATLEDLARLGDDAGGAVVRPSMHHIADCLRGWIHPDVVEVCGQLWAPLQR